MLQNIAPNLKVGCMKFRFLTKFHQLLRSATGVGVKNINLVSISAYYIFDINLTY